MTNLIKFLALFLIVCAVTFECKPDPTEKISVDNDLEVEKVQGKWCDFFPWWPSCKPKPKPPKPTTEPSGTTESSVTTTENSKNEKLKEKEWFPISIVIIIV